MQDTAKKVDLPKVNDDVCAYFYSIPAEKRLCAGYNLAAKGICSVSIIILPIFILCDILFSYTIHLDIKFMQKSLTLQCEGNIT